MISQPALDGAEEESSLHGDLHPVDQRHVGLAGGPQLLLRTPEVLGEDEEVEGEGGALQAGRVDGGEVGGDHPPVNLLLVELPGQPGRRVAVAGGAVDGDLVARQVDCLLEA